MPTNLELKAKIDDVGSSVAIACSIGARDMGMLRQRDTYFRVPRGRLKLREIEGRGAELIYYERNESGPERLSTFTITPVAEPEPLRRSLDAALGIRGVVAKTRRLFLADSTRIHLDHVEGLGSFLEFEVPVEGSPQEAEEKLLRLQREFGIESGAGFRNSYIDLIEGKGAGTA